MASLPPHPDCLSMRNRKAVGEGGASRRLPMMYVRLYFREKIKEDGEVQATKNKEREAINKKQSELSEATR